MSVRAIVAAVVLAGGGLVCAQSLTTLPANNGSGGVFLDLTPTGGALDITSFEVPYTGTVGTPVNVEIWVRPDSYIGWDASSFGWTLHETVSGVRQGTTVLSPLTLSVPLAIPAGATTGVYLHCITAGGGIRYQGTGTTATTTFSNADLMLFSDVARTGETPFAGSRFTPRAFAGTINYQPGGPAIPGACCFPNGSCQNILGADCFAQGGSFQGGGTDCASTPCPQPAACCFSDGSCDVMLQLACNNQGGTWNSSAATCAAANCPQPGGCCLSDGTCVLVMESDCATSFAGTFWGPGTSCGTQRCATLPVLWNHGPLRTGVGVGCNGADLSVLETFAPLSGSTFGFNWNSVTNSRAADRFTVPAGEQWTINEIRLFGYDTGASSITYNAVFIQIWDGDPSLPGATVVAGDLTTNRLTQASGTNIYRATDANQFDCARHIQQIDAAFQATLGPGTYWIDRTATVSSGSTPWMPVVKFLGHAGKPNATGIGFFGGMWDARLDTGNNVRQDHPFILMGSVDSACYADCDGNGTLNVDDFICFINAFSSQDPYADCDNNQTLNVDDFICFINAFSQGCP
jgi:hypothetical protein